MKSEKGVVAKIADQRITTNQIATVADLETFKQEIIDAVGRLIESQGRPKEKVWLKSYQVLKLLGISPNKLQDIRDKGLLPFTKIGGVFYYEQAEIDKMLESHKQVSRQ